MNSIQKILSIIFAVALFLLVALLYFPSDIFETDNHQPVVSKTQPPVAVKPKFPHPSDLTYAEIKFSPPQPEEAVLKNGITLFLLEDKELPVLDMAALIRTGSIYDPDDKVGLAGLATAIMRTGGTASMSGDAIDEELEFIDAAVGVHSNRTHVSASLSVMKKDLDLGLKIFADILTRPVFEQAKLDLAKKAAIEGIRRKNDDPGSITAREFNKLLYAGHPFSRESTIESVSSITRKDLAAFHKKYFYPNQMILSVSGDFDKEEIIRKLEAVFGGWKQEEVRLPEIKPVDKKFRYSVNYIEKDTTQSVIRVGHLGVKITNPDHYALQLMDDILGGSSFQSRLMQDIRTDKGLAYSVWSYFGAGVFDYDPFMIGSETKASSTARVIELMLSHMNRLRDELVTEEELNQAKQFIENSFVFKFTTSARIASRLATFRFYGLPMNYLETYLDNIRKVTREDIQRVAKEYLKPGGIIITVTGDQKKFDKPLSTFGEVNTIELESFDAP